MPTGLQAAQVPASDIPPLRQAQSPTDCAWFDNETRNAHKLRYLSNNALESHCLSIATLLVSDIRLVNTAPEFGWIAMSASSFKPKTWLDSEEEQLLPPRDLWVGPEDSVHHYYRWVWEYLAYLTLIAELRREQAVLELGCGHGRTCRALLGYLRSPGSYAGIDVDKRRIQDAQSRIQARTPNFQFIWADVISAHSNPHGAVRGADYKFPFADGSFDVIYAASLFTHLLPDETQNYLREARRVLKSGGRLLFSFFLLDHYRGPGTSVSPNYEFPCLLDQPGVAIRDPEHPDDLVGYKLETIRSLAEPAGLKIVRVYPGYWSESPGWAVNEQDMILLTSA
jgi:SAM-dependent methyltransferase